MQRPTEGLDRIRSGEWRPSLELAEFLAAPTTVTLVRSAERDAPALSVVVPKERMEIAVCAGCGRVRYKRVGRLCGHAGTCDEQTRLF